MQNFLNLWLNAGAQITHGGQVQKPRQMTKPWLNLVKILLSTGMYELFAGNRIGVSPIENAVASLFPFLFPIEGAEKHCPYYRKLDWASLWVQNHNEKSTSSLAYGTRIWWRVMRAFGGALSPVKWSDQDLLQRVTLSLCSLLQFLLFGLVNHVDWISHMNSFTMAYQKGWSFGETLTNADCDHVCMVKPNHRLREIYNHFSGVIFVWTNDGLCRSVELNRAQGHYSTWDNS